MALVLWTATPVGAWYGRIAARETLAEERETTVAGLFGNHEGEVPMVEPKELVRWLIEPDPPLIIDVRTRASYDREQTRIPDSVRVLPDGVVEYVDQHPPGRDVIAYCS